MSQSERRQRALVIRGDLVERVLDESPLAAFVVICDPDGEKAATIASRVTGHRTAVFVGDLDQQGDREAAEAMARELLGREEGLEVHVITSAERGTTE